VCEHSPRGESGLEVTIRKRISDNLGLASAGTKLVANPPNLRIKITVSSSSYWFAIS
jgi:hypothetical protein